MRLYTKLITIILVLSMVLSIGAITPLAASQSAYSEEIELVDALGIMVGDENGDFAPEKNLTRAEFAQVLTVLLQINDSESTKANAWYFKSGKATENQILNTEKAQVFADVPADHWAYNVIGQVTSLGYMIGTGENEFSPDENVTINQVNKVFVKMLGYEVFAERNGGYPAGYNYTASSIKLLKGIKHYGDTPVLRGELAKMLVNMFDVEMIDLGFVTDEGTASYEQSEKTFLEDELGVYTTKGELTSTSVTGLYGESNIAEGEVVIGGKVYKVAAGAEYINNFLGKIIDVYYVKDSNDRNIVLHAKLSDDIDDFVVDIKDFVSLSNGVLKYVDDNEKIEKLDLVSMPAIILNGTSVDTISTEMIKSYYNGTITAINSDNKGDYEMLVIEAYRTMFVKNKARDIIINGLLTQGVDKDAVLNLTEEATKNKIVSITKDGLPTGVNEIFANYVLDVAQSEGEIKIIATKNSKDMVVSGIAEDVDGCYLYDAEGNSYKVADDYAKSTEANLPTIGTNCVVYFNSFGEVAFASVNSAEYGNKALVIDAAEEGRGGLKSGIKARFFTDTGRFVEYMLAEKVSYANSEDEELRLKDEELLPILAGLKNKLVTFKVNENNEITGIKEPVRKEDNRIRNQGRLGVIYESTDAPRYVSGSIDMTAYAVSDTKFFSISGIVGLPEEEKYQVYTKKEMDALSSTAVLSTVAVYNTEKDSPEADIVVTENTAATRHVFRDNQNAVFIVDKIKQGTNADGDEVVTVEGTYIGNGRMPEGKAKTYTSKSGAFSKMHSLLGDTSIEYTVKKGDIIHCMEFAGDVKSAILIYRRDGYTYEANPRYEGGGIVGLVSGIYDGKPSSNPCAISTLGEANDIEVNGYKVATHGFPSTVTSSSRKLLDLYALRADEQYMTFTTQDLSAPGSVPDYNNPAYTIITLPVQRFMTQQVKKGNTYASGNIVFTDIKTYDAYLNDCSRVLAITANGYPYKIVVLGEE